MSDFIQEVKDVFDFNFMISLSDDDDQEKAKLKIDEQGMSL